MYDLEEIVEAHKRMESNANIGKILLKISSEDFNVDEQKNNKLDEL